MMKKNIRILIHSWCCRSPTGFVVKTQAANLIYLVHFPPTLYSFFFISFLFIWFIYFISILCILLPFLLLPFLIFGYFLLGKMRNRLAVGAGGAEDRLTALLSWRNHTDWNLIWIKCSFHSEEQQLDFYFSRLTYFPVHLRRFLFFLLFEFLYIRPAVFRSETSRE